MILPICLPHLRALEPPKARWEEVIGEGGGETKHRVIWFCSLLPPLSLSFFFVATTSFYFLLGVAVF